MPMDFEDAKENIQPLAAGRNASILHASLRMESPQELLAQRRELELAIHEYSGDDPLDPWYSYISWIEQSFPSGGKESGLEEVLTKCLSRFENEECYFQDRRMVKLYMKFIDSHQHPMECYQQLFNAGIGTMVADFYICWAYHYDLCGNTLKADEIFRRGIACRAQPLEELQEAHQHFGFTVAQRLMYQNNDDVKENTKRQLEERRLALTSLRGHRRKATVGSLRTGSVVKSFTPGTVQTSTSSLKQSNARVQVFNDENAIPNVSTPAASNTETVPEMSAAVDGKSVVRSIIDAARNQENLKEPGPWNKAHDKKKSGKLFGKSLKNADLGFNIHEDIEMDLDSGDTFKIPLQSHVDGGIQNYEKPFIYPKHFKSRNLPQKEWLTPVTIENQPDPRTFPQYNKFFMYPRPNVEYQPEEYRAYCWFRKRDISNDFTAKRERYWKSNDIDINLRQYPNFAKQSRPQKLSALDSYFEPEKTKGLVVSFNKLYDTAAETEYQNEELMAQYLRRHDTILLDTDMDETTIDINERAQRRKSFFPSRRSMMPRRTITASLISESVPMQSSVPRAVSHEPKEVFTRKGIEGLDVFVKEIPKEPAPVTAKPINSSEIPFEIFEDTIPAKPNVICEDERAEVVDISIQYKPPLPNKNPTKPSLPFEIFEDTTTIPIESSAPTTSVAFPNNVGAEAGLDFKFKTPALPSSALIPGQIKTTGLAKPGFEIYTEPSTVKDTPLTNACDGAVAGGIFDPEETCSTQQFNIFIKSQSVSTPKIPQKVAPRQFGSILKPVTNPTELISSPEPISTVEVNVEEQENIKSPSEYSPLMVKQLSTILETSEHASTQGTHTTGGTKSSNSTSDGEAEREIITRLVYQHTELDTLEEQSRESSTIPAEVIVSMENINLQSNTITTKTTNVATLKSHEKMPEQTPSLPIVNDVPLLATPAQPRLEIATDIPLNSVVQFGEPNVSVFVDERTEASKTKQVGNFTRLDEREDTAAGLAIRSVRFQEDNTETISKVLLHSRSMVKFQEDKTETLPKICIPTVAYFDVEPISTLPKLPQESSILLTTKNASTNLDDSFEFFGQTPPGKSLLHPRYEVSAFKECMESRTPLMAAAKRHCNVDTPEMMHLKAPRSIQKSVTKSSTRSSVINSKGPALFEDEVNETNSIKSKAPFSPPKILDTKKGVAPAVSLAHKIIPRDSFLPDFSLIEDTQPAEPSKIVTQVQKEQEAPLKTQEVKKTDAERNDEMHEQRAKSNLGDSYMKDFSDIMESQPTQSDHKWHRSLSKIQIGEVQKTGTDNICNSFLRDFSAVMESQPIEKDKKRQQQKQPSLNKTSDNERKNALESEKIELSEGSSEVKVKLDWTNSYLKDFSLVMESQPLPLHQDWRQNKFSASKARQEEPAVVENNGKETNKTLLKESSFIMLSQLANNERQLDQKSTPTTVKKATITTTTSKTQLGSMVFKPEEVQAKLQDKNKLDSGSSYMKDLSYVPESQPIRNDNKLVLNKLNPSIQINDSYLKEFSLPLQASKLESASKPSTDEFQKPTLEPVPAKPLIFLDSFMKDFSGFNVDPMSNKKSAGRLTFLNESKKLTGSTSSVPVNTSTHKEIKTTQTPTKLHFLNNSKPIAASQALPLANRLSTEKSFELNAETAMFSTNISMIKNSTLLPINEPYIFKPPTPIKEQSLHIKLEEDTHIEIDDNNLQKLSHFKTPPMTINKLTPSAPNFLGQSKLQQENVTNISKGAVPKRQIPMKSNVNESKIPQLLSSTKKPTTRPMPALTSVEILDEPIDVAAIEDDDDVEMSIYFKHTPKTPKITQHVWNESSPSPKTLTQNVYVHREVDLNVTNQTIDNITVDPNANPFNGYLQSAFLEQIEFSNYIEELPNCMLVGHVSRLHAAAKVKIHNFEIEVSKLIGEGAYGAVYCGVESKTGKKYALKQERPPNFWEYYICLEVHSRLHSDDLVCAFMSIDYALIGNNASVLISPFSTYGSLITICNKVKKHTLRNVDEYVVMLLTCELLSIIDHLHSINIIHADIKADNFLLMKKLEYPSRQYALQLIDFGVSIDMKLFKPGQTFNYVHKENAFKCVEMREGRRWTYQLDLYGLAGVIHVLLFGKFMDIAQRPNGSWMHKTHIPRYINRTLWDTIFQTLLNVRDCETMPNLQNLRALIKEEIAEKEKFVLRKVAEFNLALSS